MKKKSVITWKRALLIVLAVVVVLLALILIGKSLAFAIFSSDKATPVVNPLTGLSQEQALAQFNESFVSYLLSMIGAQRLHNIPFTSYTPKIEIEVSGKQYSVEIKKGQTIVSKGTPSSPDLRIVTTKEEALKMIKDKAAIKTSFQSGASTVNVLAGKPTLLAKGYWSIYNELS